tara:strand:+ start:15984 stop:16481 length:498 start_codon:yes stop_codon:yes gene_type:complete
LKTKRDISISVIIILLGLSLFLPAALSVSFSQILVGKIWMTVTLLLIFLGLLKIEQIQIIGNNLTKSNFIFRRSIELNRITQFKIKVNDMNTYSRYNIAAILKIFKNGERYSNFRVLTIHTDGKRSMKIDERTMPTSDFKKILSEIKKGKKHLTTKRSCGRNCPT